MNKCGLAALARHTRLIKYYVHLLNTVPYGTQDSSASPESRGMIRSHVIPRVLLIHHPSDSLSSSTFFSLPKEQGGTILPPPATKLIRFMAMLSQVDSG